MLVLLGEFNDKFVCDLCIDETSLSIVGLPTEDLKSAKLNKHDSQYDQIPYTISVWCTYIYIYDK